MAVGWREEILKKLRRLRESEAAPPPPQVVPLPPEPTPPPVPTPPPPPAPVPGPAPSPFPDLPPAPGPMPNPPTLVEKDAAFVEAAYRSYIGKVGYNAHRYGYPLINYQNARNASDKRDGMLRYPMDARYRLPATPADLRRLVIWGRSLDKRPWTADLGDCDDRAGYLKAILAYHLGVSIGMVYDGHASHVFNIAVLGDGTVWVVEPEDATVYPIEAQRFPMLNGLILH